MYSIYSKFNLQFRTGTIEDRMNVLRKNEKRQELTNTLNCLLFNQEAFGRIFYVHINLKISQVIKGETKTNQTQNYLNKKQSFVQRFQLNFKVRHKKWVFKKLNQIKYRLHLE